MKWLKSSLLILLTSFSFAAIKNQQIEVKELDVNNFSKGLDSYHDSTVIPDGFVQDSLNVYFDRKAPVEKRQGYNVLFSSKGYSYNTAWTYTDGTNTAWTIVRASDSIIASNSAGSVVLIATVSANNNVDEVNAFGNAYFVDVTQGVYYWNGIVTTYVAGSPKGSIIAQFHNRVWVSGQAVPNGNLLNASKFLDGTVWAIGTNATDPAQFTIGLQDNFDNITALYPFLDTLYIFKYTSIYALYGFDNNNFQNSILNRECGCVDKYSVQAYNKGILLVSLRGLEYFDGYNCNRISDPIKDKIDAAVQLTSFNQQSWVQQTQVDWNAGTLNQLSSSISPPALVLSTQTAFSGVDNSQGNWNAGTLTNLDSTATLNSLQLSSDYGSEFLDQKQEAQNNQFGTTTSDNAASFTTSSNSPQQITSVAIECLQQSGPNYTISINSDNAGVPGGVLVSATLNSSNCGSGSEAWNKVSLTPTSLSPSTKYWVYLTKAGTYPNQIQWGYQSVASAGNHWDSTNGLVSTVNNTFREYVKIKNAFITTGAITSRVFDTGFSTNTFLWNWGMFNTTETDNGQTIVYETQVSNSSIGPWDTPVIVSPGGIIGSATKEFIQYIATMTTNNTSVTPILTNVTLNTSLMEKSSGTFKSQIHTIPSINSWGNFSVVDTLNSGNIIFSVCSSTSPTMISAGVSPSCANQTLNTQITVSTGTPGKSTYVQWYATFTVTAATQTPTLNSGVIQWFSGSKANPMASAVYDNRYWLAITSSPADSANDAIIVMNAAMAFTIFDIHAGGLVVVKNSLYHSDSLASGNVYLDNQGYNDNGNAIISYIRTRDYNLGSWIVDTLFDSLWPSMINLGNFVVNISYALDKGTVDYNLADVNQNEFASARFSRIPFPMSTSNPGTAQTVNFKINANQNNEPWQFEGLSLLYHERHIQE